MFFTKKGLASHTTHVAHQTWPKKSSGEFSLPLLSLPSKNKAFYREMPDHQELDIVYSTIFENFSPQDELNIFASAIEASFPFVDFLYLKMSQNSKEIGFRVWHTNVEKNVVSRVLYLCMNKTWTFSTHCFYKVFGNVDLMLVSPQKDDQNIDWCYHQDIEKIKMIPPPIFLELAKYLDHGQSFNFARLAGIFGKTWFDYFETHFLTPHEQNFYDFCYYSQTAPNKSSMLYQHKNKLFAHISMHKEKILTAKNISLSKGGCLGSVIYSLQVLDDLYMSGLAIGISERIFPGKLLDDKKLFIFSKQNAQKNEMTNWINSLGFGRIKLEALLLVFTEIFKFKPIEEFLKSTQINHVKIISSLVMAHYEELYPLLDYFRGYSGRRTIFLKQAHYENFIDREFEYFWSAFDNARNIKQDKLIAYDIRQFYWLNTLLFETLKDYIILHQKTRDQNLLGQYGSFDMHNQYQFFFSLDPELKKQGFKTELFSPTFENIVQKLKNHGVDLSTHEKTRQFKAFLLNRFSSAIHVFLLDGISDFPKPALLNALPEAKFNTLYIFLELARFLPNLAGNLVHSVLTKLNFSDNSKKNLHDCLLGFYQEMLRSLYGLSYNERNIDIPIKANICGTDEVGIQELPDITIHECILDAHDKPLYKIEKISEPIDVKIKGISNFVQLRANETMKNPLNNFFSRDELQELACLIANSLDRLKITRLYLLRKLIAENPQSLDLLKKTGVNDAILKIIEGPSLHLDVKIEILISIRTIFGFLTIKSYQQAYQKLIHHPYSEDLVRIMLANIMHFAELSQIQLLYFLSKYRSEKLVLPNNFLQMIECLTQSLLDSPDPKVKFLVVQTLLYWIKLKQLSFLPHLIMLLKHESESDPDFSENFYSEITNFIISSDLKSFENESLLFFTDFFVNKLSHHTSPYSILKALVYLSLLPISHPSLLRRSTMESFIGLNNQNRQCIPDILKIIFHISSVAKNCEPLLAAIFSHLCALIEKQPVYSQLVFDILNNMISLMQKEHILEISKIAQRALYLCTAPILLALPSFFYNLRIHGPAIRDIEQMFLLTEGFDAGVSEDEIDAPVIQFVSSSFNCLRFKQSFIEKIIEVLLKRIVLSPKISFFYYIALERFLEIESNKVFFLKKSGLNVLILSSAFIKNIPSNREGLKRHFSRKINAILKLFINDSLDLTDFPIAELKEFYMNLLEDEDLIADATAFLLKTEEGSSFIAELSLSKNILIGLSEISLTDEVCKSLISTPLLMQISNVIRGVLTHKLQEEGFDDQYVEVVLKLVINLCSRKSLYNKLLEIFPGLIDGLQKFDFDENHIDLEFQEEIKMIINKSVALYSPSQKSIISFVEKLKFYKEIIDGTLFVNEYSLSDKKELIDILLGSLDNSDGCLELAARALEKLAKNNCFSSFFSSQSMINQLKEKLICVNMPVKSYIIDTLFWMTVNNHEISEKIQFSGMLPVLMSLLKSPESTAETVRATLGLLVNLGFANDEKILLPYLGLFIHFLSSSVPKIVINSLELLMHFENKKMNALLNHEEQQQFFTQLSYLKNSDNKEIRELSRDLVFSLFPKRYSAFKNLNDKAKTINRFGLPFLTYHPNIIYKRKKYFPELQAHLPNKNSYHHGFVDSSYYVKTKYLNPKEAENYRVIIKEGLIHSTRNSFSPLTTDIIEIMVCVTMNGEIYSSAKENYLQHTSFNKGGYLLFAGYWHVEEGIVKKIIAESGHYEPSPIALQNFAYLLQRAGCRLNETVFLYADRRLVENPTDTLNFSKTDYCFLLDDLLSEKPIQPNEEDPHISFVTHKKLSLLSQHAFFYRRIEKNVLNVSSEKKLEETQQLIRSSIFQS